MIEKLIFRFSDSEGTMKVVPQKHGPLYRAESESMGTLIGEWNKAAPNSRRLESTASSSVGDPFSRSISFDSDDESVLTGRQESIAEEETKTLMLDQDLQGYRLAS